MDYKEKVIALLNSQELSKEQKEELENIFPELKESEDERIRKALIFHFQGDGYLCNKVGNIPNTDILAWLEKQGKHANFLNKIQIGDKVTRNEDGVLVNLSQLKRVAKKDEKQGEQKPKRMVSAEAKEAMYDKPAWSEEDESLRLRTIGALETCKIGSPTKCVDEQINWLKSLKCRVPTQPKFEWNEEDEDILNTIINHFEIDLECTKNDDIINWLKSLRPQNQWKPSDEQMAVLNEVINYAANSELQHWSSFIYTLLKSLREQLKKLKG